MLTRGVDFFVSMELPEALMNWMELLENWDEKKKTRPGLGSGWVFKYVNLREREIRNRPRYCGSHTFYETDY